MSSDPSPLPETSRELTDRPRHADAPGEPDRPPHDRLRILDLLIWTACIAACLGWFRFGLGWRGIDWGSAGTQVVEWGLQALVVGTAITAVFLVGPKVLRPAQRPSVAPGEWLWLLRGVEAGLTILLVAAEMLAERVIAGGPILVYQGHGYVEHIDYTTYSRLMACLAMGIAVLRAAMATTAYFVFKSVRFVRWQAIFACLALMYLLESVGLGIDALSLLGLYDGEYEVMTVVSYVTNGALRVFPAALVLIALLIDWRSHHTFPWKHWLGGIVLLGGLVVTASFLLGWP